MTALAAEDLRVRADDGTALLSDVSVAIDAGETVLLCGGPGSGKTLLGKALVGLLDDRPDLAVAGTVRRPAEVGYVFQYPAIQLVRRTVRLDVGFGLENRGVEPAAIADRVERIAKRFEVADLLDRSVDALSAGETATVAVLGAIVTEPDAVVLDEPLSTLDYPGTKRLLAAIDRLRATDTAIVVAEHDPRDLLARSDRVLHLDGGRVADAGPPRAVAPALHRAGVRLPFATRVAIERGEAGERPLPLAADGPEVEAP